MTHLLSGLLITVGALTSSAAANDGRHVFVTCGGIDAVAKVDVVALKVVAVMKAGFDADGLGWSAAAPG